MENGKGSTHLKPYILPPLGVPKSSNETGKHLQDRPLRQRIGTPAPQKKSPIPDDLDLDNLDVVRGNPAIKVESDEAQRIKYLILSEKTLRALPEDTPGSGNDNSNCRITKKAQLQPITNPILNMRNHGDLNGNSNRRRSIDAKIVSSEIPIAGKVHLPNKYTPLKPITRKKSDFD